MSNFVRSLLFLLVPALLGLALVAGCLSGPQAPPIAPTASPADDLAYYTEELRPYSYQENGTLRGISVDLLGAVTERMGTRVTPDRVRVVPWAEGYEAALTGNRTVLFSMARTPARETSFKWAGPIFTDREVLFARNGSGIAIAAPGNLAGLRIGVIADDIGVQQLLDLGVSQGQLVTERDPGVLMDRLQRGEIDLWCYPEATGRHLSREATGDFFAFTVAYPLSASTVYYAFSRDVPDATVAAFQQALDGLKQERDAAGISRYEKVLEAYIPRSSSGTPGV